MSRNSPHLSKNETLNAMIHMSFVLSKVFEIRELASCPRMRREELVMPAQHADLEPGLYRHDTISMLCRGTDGLGVGPA